jgi:hypothetical protein
VVILNAKRVVLRLELWAHHVKIMDSTLSIRNTTISAVMALGCLQPSKPVRLEQLHIKDAALGTTLTA